MSVIALKGEGRTGFSPDSGLRTEPPHELLHRAAALAGIGAWSCDLPDERLAWTPAVFDLFGLPSSTRLDRRAVVEHYTPQSRDELERLRSAAIASGAPFALDAQIVRPDGGRRWLRITAEVVRQSGRPVRLCGLKQDITEDRNRLEALRRQAEHDPLTGLCNRSVFQRDFLDRPCETAAAAPLGALLLLDADGFKQINDRHGHAAGDACLEALGRRIALGFPDALLAARIGGDELALLLRARGESLAAIAARVRRQLRQLAAPIPWRGALLGITLSGGLAPTDNPLRYDAEALFAAADAALYRAKQAGRNRLHVAGEEEQGGPRPV